MVLSTRPCLTMTEYNAITRSQSHSFGVCLSMRKMAACLPCIPLLRSERAAKPGVSSTTSCLEQELFYRQHTTRRQPYHAQFISNSCNTHLPANEWAQRCMLRAGPTASHIVSSWGCPRRHPYRIPLGLVAEPGHKEP